MQVFKKYLFVIILCVLTVGVTFGIKIIMNRNSDYVQNRNKRLYDIKQEPENTIDVIVVGDSLDYCGVSTMQLWKEHGISSYVCAESAQKIQQSYKMIEAAMEKQSPKVVMLETTTLFRGASGINGIKDVLDEWVNQNITLVRYHDIWKTFFVEKEFKKNSYNGFDVYTTIDPYFDGNQYYEDKTDKMEVLPDTTKLYMNKIIKLCQDNHAELVLYLTPSPKNYTYSKHNTIQKYADEHQLRYLDMNLKTDELGIDWEVDTLDQGDHLNIAGAIKLTKYLGEYLSSNFELIDHRDDSEYLSWDAMGEKYDQEVQKGLETMGLR